jgi:hypothetical protein
LYDLLSIKNVEDMPATLFDGDPFNELTAAAGRFHRTINPKYLSQFVAWKRKLGDTIPPRESIYFRMFCHEEEVQRWHKLGTLPRVDDLPAGAELRKRLLRSGEIKRSEISWYWDLWWAILLKNSTECFFIPCDTPTQYEREFPGIESKPALPEPPPTVKAQPKDDRSLEVTPVSPTIQPALVVQHARPAGAPKEVCSFCVGVPPEAVPPHRCSDYQGLAAHEDLFVDLNSMNNREAPRSRSAVAPIVSQDEKIKEKIVRAGFGDAIEGNRVRFDNQLITFSEWQKQHQHVV